MYLWLKWQSVVKLRCSVIYIENYVLNTVLVLVDETKLLFND